MARRHSTPTPDSPQGSVPRYRDRIFDDLRHDPYKSRRKYKVITTCDIHSARRIEALESAYHGDLDMRFGEDEYSVRVNWRR